MKSSTMASLAFHTRQLPGRGAFCKSSYSWSFSLCQLLTKIKHLLNLRPAAMQPWECNGVISVSGVTVRPGDAIIGDQDGVVVVPAKVAEKVYNIAHGREVIEEIVKEELTKNPGPPGKFYPFMSGKITVNSPLGELLKSKGITPENSNQFEGSADW